MNYEVLALVREALAAREREERERVHDEVREAYSDKALNLDFDAIVANVAELQGITFTEEQHRHWLEWGKADADALKATAQEE